MSNIVIALKHHPKRNFKHGVHIILAKEYGPLVTWLEKDEIQKAKVRMLKLS